MNKQPFTNAGFQALQTELYQLTDAELEVQAQQILLDFKSWISDHFELTAAQLSFLNLIDQLTVSFLAAQTSLAIANRLGIALIKTEDAVFKDDRKRKIIRATNDMEVTADSEMHYEASGSLDIIIEYEELG